jgi:nitrogen regulatory protein P-II 1
VNHEPVESPPVRSLGSRELGNSKVTSSPSNRCPGVPVKLIIAIVQPNRLEQIKEALSQVEVFRLTVVDCMGYARQKGEQNAQRTGDGSIQLLRKLQLQIAVNEEFVEPTIQAILKGAKSEQEGRIGDGKIFVLPMEECIRIRTSERGTEAI